MKLLTKENIVIALILIVFIQGFFEVPNGFSEEDVLYKIKIHDLQQDKLLLLKQNNQFEFKIKKFQDEKNKIDSITDNYSKPQIDSFYTNYFAR